ncbi:MAG: hypothetical protein HYZ37_17535 [Candidatus Solibacter usitatus]|nr:hypothetical protein [Candidatus Solibacter usitatus]
MMRIGTVMDNALSGILRWPTDESKQWVAQFLNLAHADSNIVAVIAIGSAVRPNVPSADVDLLVIAEDPVLHTGNRPLEVDLRAYAVAEANQQIANGNDMLGWAIKFGRLLFQRDRYWTKVVESWRHRLPLPSAELARERAAGSHRRLATVSEFGDADAAREQAGAYLTHLARAALLENGVYPASRPELPSQLRKVGKHQLADWLDGVLTMQVNEHKLIREVMRLSA